MKIEKKWTFEECSADSPEELRKQVSDVVDKCYRDMLDFIGRINYYAGGIRVGEAHPNILQAYVKAEQDMQAVSRSMQLTEVFMFEPPLSNAVTRQMSKPDAIRFVLARNRVTLAAVSNVTIGGDDYVKLVATLKYWSDCYETLRKK